ncbi:DUF2254 domain-containing protein [Candidatus Gracilibacteria bacterium]|nr:DUF2254 domain-containing protein [Candidatus Gracilibacteria bacterium]
MEPLRALPSRLATIRDKLRTSFWFVPALMSVAAAILAFVTLFIDARLGEDGLSRLTWLYSGGPEGARSLLSTVASSSITVAGTTFSITIAALSLASSQFGPRLLRNFVRDTGNQVVLGTFVATFLYCLLVVRTVRGLEDNRVVPHLSVTIGVLLAIANLGVLIYFIHHVAMAIRADKVIAAVAHDLDQAVEDLFPAQLGQGLVAQHANQTASVPDVPPDAQPVALDHDGYLQMIDADMLLGFTTEHDLTVQLLRRPGEFIVADEPIVMVWPQQRLDPDRCNVIRDAFILGGERSAQQDVLFVINQLVEVAARALSPGINDPLPRSPRSIGLAQRYAAWYGGPCPMATATMTRASCGLSPSQCILPNSWVRPSISFVSTGAITWWGCGHCSTPWRGLVRPPLPMNSAQPCVDRRS